MYSCLLKKLVPFALTFIIGSVVGGLFNSFGWRSTPAFGGLGVGQSYRFERRYSCRMHAHDLVAETKPLVILFKPDARLPRELHGGRVEATVSEHVIVTFGADGKVQQVEPVEDSLLADEVRAERQGYVSNYGAHVVWDAVERAARQIQFTPEMINSVPVSVTKDIEIHFMADK
ncbi:MAG TPA: hypothetical protein VFA21_12575 [Pyrinomonadaceae bacterium]|jgi:hypothetical protein|nr:hypothetical protein [Pyrinomonadaceae bacterium]